MHVGVRGVSRFHATGDADIASGSECESLMIQPRSLFGNRPED